ncbi:MAG: LCP family protein [Caldilineaceae bacterium]|nr:LCP family protein [Caldilineaceae bacterium]
MRQFHALVDSAGMLSPGSTTQWLRRRVLAGLLIAATILLAGCGSNSAGTVVRAESRVDTVAAREDKSALVSASVEEADLTSILASAPEDVQPVAAVLLENEPLESASLAASTTDRLVDTNTLPLLSRTVNVLILGSDRRPRTPNWRTDVIMIVAMDLKSGRAGVISIPRDVYISPIPNHRPNRINVIDYLGEQDEPDGGGPALLASVIEEKMGVPIHHYLRFDFEGFKKVVDALGGLEITLDCPVSDYLPEEDISIRLQAGTHRLDGRQALGYVRSRRQGGDLERSRRQQRVIWAVRDQIQRENMISKVPALYAALHNSVQTDIGLVSAIRYVRFALALDPDDVHGFVLSPPDLLRSGWQGGMSVFIADWDRIREQVQTIFDRPPFMEANTVGEGSETARCP